jgi:uncharacterized Tic20 family protein
MKESTRIKFNLAVMSFLLRIVCGVSIFIASITISNTFIMGFIACFIWGMTNIMISEIKKKW